MDLPDLSGSVRDMRKANPHSRVGADLRRLFKDSGLTYQQLEDRTGIRNQTLWEIIENDRGDASVARYEAIAEALQRHLALVKGKA